MPETRTFKLSSALYASLCCERMKPAEGINCDWEDFQALMDFCEPAKCPALYLMDNAPFFRNKPFRKSHAEIVSLTSFDQTQSSVVPAINDWMERMTQQYGETIKIAQPTKPVEREVVATILFGKNGKRLLAIERFQKFSGQLKRLFHRHYVSPP